MGVIKLDGLPFEQPVAEPWPVDEHTIRVDEMFARQLDNEFSAGVRGLLHDPETGISAQRGEAALHAIAGAMPALSELKDRTLAGVIGPRQRSILEPLIETRLDWAAGTLGQLAQRATVEVDDASVAERIAGLNRDAAAAWQDPAYLRRLGRTAVEELRYQGERRGWDPADTDARVRGGLSDLYAGAVETAMGGDLGAAQKLFDHAREVIAPAREAILDRKFREAREDAVIRDVDRNMLGIPIDPAGPPGAGVFEERAAELTPEDASAATRDRIAQVTAFAQRRAERQWQKQQAEAGVAALDWLNQNPNAPLVTLPFEVRDWLAPDQWDALTRAAIAGRVETDGEIRDRLDRQAVHDPQAFASLDLDRHRLVLDDQDFARLAAIQQAEREGRTDLAQIRWAHTLTGLDRALEARGIDRESPAAREARTRARDRLDSFETIEGRLPRRADLDDIVQRTAGTVAPPEPGTASVELEAPPAEIAVPEMLGPDSKSRVIHHDDGSAEVTAGKVPTPAGPAQAMVRLDRDRRGATAEMVLPDGRRVESRRTSPDGRTWSQIDRTCDPRGSVIGTQTTTFDDRRITRTWEPADGPAQTTIRDATEASGDVHLASDEAVLGLGTLGAMAVLPAAPLVAAAIVIGLGAYAAHGVYQHFMAPDALEDQSRGAISKAVPPEKQPAVVVKEGQPEAVEEKGGKAGAEQPIEAEKQGPQIKDLTRLSKGEIRTLGKGGFDVHGEKDKDKTGPVDLFKDRDGNIYVGRQDGRGEAEPLYDNIKHYR